MACNYGLLSSGLLFWVTWLSGKQLQLLVPLLLLAILSNGKRTLDGEGNGKAIRGKGPWLFLGLLVCKNTKFSCLIYVNTYISIYINIFIYLCMNIRVYAYTHIYIYIHAHMYTAILE